MAITCQLPWKHVFEIGSLRPPEGREQFLLSAEQHLRYSCDPGTHTHYLIIVGTEIAKILLRLRARTHQAHLSADNIDELWEFIELGDPQPPADDCDSTVTGRRKSRAL